MKSMRWLGLILSIVFIFTAFYTPIWAWGENAEKDPQVSAVHTFGEGTENYISINYDIPVGKPGETVTLAIPIRLARYLKSEYEDETGETVTDIVDVDLASNMINKKVVSYNAKTKAEYDQEITQWIKKLRLTIDTSEADELPFEVKESNPVRYIFEEVKDNNGKIVRDEDGKIVSKNYGFAVFDNLKIKSTGVTNSTYNIPLKLWWLDLYEEEHTASLNAQIKVTGVKDSSGGGSIGGGGGGGSVDKPLPEAKLIVDGIETDPKDPKAGDTFDVILTLRNTSEDQDLQNIELKYTTEDDALLPASGSSTIYIKKIEKNSTYVVRLPVKSQPDMADKPVKMEVGMEFEDKKLTPLNATQTMILNVRQPQRIRVEDPVLPTTPTYVGESFEFTIDIRNEGKPTLYNVSARVITEDENLIPGQSVYAGHMEPGSSKPCELEVIPMKEGNYQATVEVSYEAADGTLSSEKKEISLYAMNAEEDIDFGMNDIIPETTPTPDPTALIIMRALPWWLYAGIAGIFLLLIMTMGVGARRRRRKALEEDEMD